MVQFDPSPLTAHLSTFLNHLPSVFYMTQAKSPFQMIYLSPTISQLGFSLTDPSPPLNFWKESWLPAIHIEDHPLVIQNLSTILEKKQVDQVYRFTQPNGIPCKIRDQISLILDEQGQPEFLFGFWTEMDPEIIDFIPSKIAHELNNPLAIVLGKIGILLKKLEGPAAEGEREQLTQGILSIQKAANRVAELITTKKLKKLVHQPNPSQGDSK